MVSGGAASPVPREAIAELVRAVPDGRMVTVEAGHLVHATKPAAFIRRLAGFLDA